MLLLCQLKIEMTVAQMVERVVIASYEYLVVVGGAVWCTLAAMLRQSAPNRAAPATYVADYHQCRGGVNE